MAVSFLLPTTPCCGQIIFWEEVHLRLPCVAGEYALAIPGDAPQAFVEGVQDMLRHHNAAEHGVDISLHLQAAYGCVEAPGAVGRHSGTTPGPVRTSARCQCMGAAQSGGGMVKRQCALAADTVTSGDPWRTCRPCREYCRILVPDELGMHIEHRVPLTVHRGRFN